MFIIKSAEAASCCIMLGSLKIQQQNRTHLLSVSTLADRGVGRDRRAPSPNGRGSMICSCLKRWISSVVFFLIIWLKHAKNAITIKYYYRQHLALSMIFYSDIPPLTKSRPRQVISWSRHCINEDYYDCIMLNFTIRTRNNTQ